MNASKNEESGQLTTALAWTGLVPVLIFFATALYVGLKINSVVFTAGAFFYTFAGFCRVGWKMSAAKGKKNMSQLRSLSIPLMVIGMILLIIGLVLTFVNGTLTLENIRDDLASFPAIVLIGIGVVFLCVLGVLRFRHTKAEYRNNLSVNWRALIYNILAQAFILAGVVAAVRH